MTRADHSGAVGPLDGIRVFDWTIYGVGPFAGMLLAALGADVIKVEAPTGDPMNRERGRQHGLGAMYMNYNLGKRSIKLDLAQPRDQARALDLLAECDIFLNNMRPGTADRLGVGYDVVSRVDPDIIYCAATAWGDKGPMAGLGGVDVLGQAFVGWASVNGWPDGRPELGRHLGYVDHCTSCYIVAGILQALLVRERTGEGQRIDVTLLGSTLAMQTTRLAEYFATGEVVPRSGNASRVLAPDQAFLCQDQQYLAVSVVEDGQWERLCTALGQPGLREDPRYRTNAGRVEHREELVGQLREVFATRPTAWWDLQLTRHRVPHGRFWDFERIRYHPQILENGLLELVDTGQWGKLYAGGPPWKFSENVVGLRRNPYPGEHTDEVLEALARGELRRRRERTGRPVSRAGAAPSAEAPAGVDRAPLAGVQVLDLTRGIAGPYGAQLLADSGACVVKVELPEGDYARGWGPPWVGEVSAVFATLNRNKELVRLKTSDETAHDEVLRRASEVDVVLVDLVGPAGEPPLLTYEVFRAVNPTGIYGAVTPFGERGPLATQPGSESVAQALGNVWGGLGEIGQPPLRVGADVASMNTGVTLYQGVLSALYWRQRTGRGQRVAVSLLGTLFSLKNHHWGALSDPDDWDGIVHNSFTNPPNYGYRTKDGAIYFVFYRSSDEDFQRLLLELGMPDDVLTDPRFQEGPWVVAGVGRYAAELRPVWERAFADKTTAEVMEILHAHQVDAVPINDYAMLTSHPQVLSLEILDKAATADGKRFTFIRPPWRFSKSSSFVMGG